jgi:hypothetical protein
VFLVNLGEATEVRIDLRLSGAMIERALEVGEAAAISTDGSKVKVVLGAKSAVALRIGG